jgi:hypothetical protein
MTPRHALAAPAPLTPSRDDHETTSCPVCQLRFTPAGRQAYCSPRCRKTAFRRRHSGPAAAITLPPARPRSRYTIYECPLCGQRQAGQQRCDDCGTFTLRAGTGGPCPHCGDPVLISDLLQAT